MKLHPIQRRPGSCGLLSAAGLAVLLAGLPAAGAHAQVALRRDLLIDGEFGFVTAIAADRQGRVYVADDMAQQLQAFDATGTRLPLVGGRGAGPGEFAGLQSLVVGRGDTLYAFDANQRRITAFAPGAQRRVAYTINVQTLGRELPSQHLLVPSRGPFLLTFTAPFGTQPGAGSSDAGRTLTLRTVDRRGRLGEQPVLRSPDKDAMVTRRGRSVSVTGLPYGRAPFFLMGAGDRLYYGWNASPDVTTYDLQGRRLGTVRTGTAPLPVRRDDIEVLEASYPPGTQELENLRLALSEHRVPATKPAYKAMLVDDRGRLWVNVSTTDDVVVLGGIGLTYTSKREYSGGQPGVSPWWVFDASGRRVAIYTVPSSVRLWEVRGDRAYGVDLDEDGVQRVVRYAVTR